MSADATGDGEALGAGVEEESPKLAPSDLLAATSTIAAVDKSPLGVMSNTLCLKLGRFGVEEGPGAIFEGDQGGTARQRRDCGRECDHDECPGDQDEVEQGEGQGEKNEGGESEGGQGEGEEGQRGESECGQGEGEEGQGGDNEGKQRRRRR
jgi:hypothetical protein